VLMFGNPSAASGQIGFGWNVDSWPGVNGSCNGTDSFPRGHTQAQANQAFATPTHFIDGQQ
jgi:hypothetical protein